MKMDKLQERIKETKARLAETKSDYQRVADLVKVNSECAIVRPVECHLKVFSSFRYCENSIESVAGASGRQSCLVASKLV